MLRLQELDNLIVEHTKPPVLAILRSKLQPVMEQVEAYQAADLLRDGVYELRARFGTVNYRLLYFFHGQNVAVLAHAITKEDEIPTVEIDRALERKMAFAANPSAHTFIGDLDDA